MNCYKQPSEHSKTDRAGSAYWKHYLDPPAGSGADDSGAKESGTPKYELADAATRDRVYSTALAAFALSDDDRTALKARGLDEKDIARLGLKSWSFKTGLAATKRLSAEVGVETMYRCPGFYAETIDAEELDPRLAPIRLALLSERIKDEILAALPDADAAVVSQHARAIATTRNPRKYIRPGAELPAEHSPATEEQARALAAALGHDEAMQARLRALPLSTEFRCPATVDGKTYLRWTRKAKVVVPRIGGQPGLIIPVRNQQGSIASLLLRPDWSRLPEEERKDAPKYLPLTSKTDEAVRYVQSVHFAVRHSNVPAIVAVVVEGVLKADVTQALLERAGHDEVQVLGLPGLALLDLPDVLTSMGAPVVVLALDADARENPAVATAQAAHLCRLLDEGHKPLVALWAKEKGKGIDDVLAACGVGVVEGRHGLDALLYAREALELAKAPAHVELERRIVLHDLPARIRLERARAISPAAVEALAGLDPHSESYCDALDAAEEVLSKGRLEDLRGSLKKARRASAEEARAATAGEGEPAWAADLERVGGGDVKSTFANAVTIMTRDSRWSGILFDDRFANKIRFQAPPPWSEEARGSEEIKPGDCWADADADRLVDWLGRYWRVHLRDGQVGRLALLVARKNARNPLQEYLRSCAARWDRKPRIEEFLITYFGAVDTPYHRLVGRFALMQAAARGLNPGCKADHVLVLEGDQGLKKSTAVKRLSPERQWVSDTPFAIGTKDGYIGLQGKWLIELAEAETLMRAESRSAKAFFSAESDSYRVPYGRINEEFPRACVFFATINPEGEGYLRDPTGNRRYWPVPCGTIDGDAIERDRDQLWAEAAHRVLAGERYWPETPEEKALCGEVQEQRRELNVWQDTIAAAVARFNHVTTGYICEHVLKIALKDVRHVDHSRITSVLAALRFESKPVRFRDPTTGESFVKRAWERRTPLPEKEAVAFVPSEDGLSNVAPDPRSYGSPGLDPTDLPADWIVAKPSRVAN